MYDSGVFDALTIPVIKEIISTILPGTQLKSKMKKADATMQLKAALSKLSDTQANVADDLRKLMTSRSSEHIQADNPLKMVYDRLADALQKPVKRKQLSDNVYKHAMERWKARPKNIPNVRAGSTYEVLKDYHDKYNWQVTHAQRDAYTKAIEYLVQMTDVEVSKKYKTIDVGIPLTEQANKAAEAQTDAAIQAEFVADLSEPPQVDVATMHKDRADVRTDGEVAMLPKVRKNEVVQLPFDPDLQTDQPPVVLQVGPMPFIVPDGTLFPPNVKLPPGAVGPGAVPLDGIVPPGTILPPGYVFPPGVKWPGGIVPPGVKVIPQQIPKPDVINPPPKVRTAVKPIVKTGLPVKKKPTPVPPPVPVPKKKQPVPPVPIGTTKIPGPGPMPRPPKLVTGPQPTNIIDIQQGVLPRPGVNPPLTNYGDGVLPGDGGGGGGGGRGRAGANGCPAGFFEGIVDLQRVKEDGPGPLFKYVYILDVLKDYDIDKMIYVRVARTMIEAVLVEGVKEFHVKTLAFFLNHVEGQLFVNMPTEADSKKLSFVTNIGRETDTNDVAKHLFKNIDVNSFPIHFLMMSDFQVDESAIMPAIASENTARRVLRAYKRQDHEVREEY